MRISVRALALATLVAVPAIPALAAKPTTSPAKPVHPTRPACKPVPAAGVAYVVRGVLTADATATSISLKVTGGNTFGKRATKDAPGTGVSVAIGTCTRITRVTVLKRQRIQGWANLKTGDRVLLKWNAARGKSLADLGAPRRIVELGHVRTVAPLPPATS